MDSYPKAIGVLTGCNTAAIIVLALYIHRQNTALKAELEAVKTVLAANVKNTGELKAKLEQTSSLATATSTEVKQQVTPAIINMDSALGGIDEKMEEMIRQGDLLPLIAQLDIIARGMRELGIDIPQPQQQYPSPQQYPPPSQQFGPTSTYGYPPPSQQYPSQHSQGPRRSQVTQPPPGRTQPQHPTRGGPPPRTPYFGGERLSRSVLPPRSDVDTATEDGPEEGTEPTDVRSALHAVRRAGGKR
jgi:hypothetical protein